MSHTSNLAVQTDLLMEIAGFYADQMPLLEGHEFDAFADTFTEDAVFGYYGAWQLEGRVAILGGMRSNIPRYGTSKIRHWFDNRRIEPLDNGVVRVTASCLVSVTSEDGDVTFEPSCTVTDELVRTDQGLRVRSRIIRHDVPDVGRYFAQLAARHA